MYRPEVKLTDDAKALRDQAGPDDYVNKYMFLALWLAKSYQLQAEKAGIDLEDLQGEALLALVSASKNFATSKAKERGIPFKAYMTTAVKYALLDMLQKAPLAHMPSRIVHEDVRALKQAAAALQSKTEGEYIADERLAKELGWSLEKVQTYQKYSRALMNYVEFQRPVAGLEKESSFGEMLPDDTDVAEKAVEKVLLEEEREWLTKATAELPLLARAAVTLTFGLAMPGDVPGPTVGDIIKVALNQSASASRGLRNLRRVRNDDKGDMPELGKQNTSVRFSGRKSPKAVAGKKEQRMALDFWQRCNSDPAKRPPALTGGAVGN